MKREGYRFSHLPVYFPSNVRFTRGAAKRKNANMTVVIAHLYKNTLVDELTLREDSPHQRRSSPKEPHQGDGVKVGNDPHRSTRLSSRFSAFCLCWCWCFSFCFCVCFCFHFYFDIDFSLHQPLPLPRPPHPLLILSPSPFLMLLLLSLLR